MWVARLLTAERWSSTRQVVAVGARQGAGRGGAVELEAVPTLFAGGSADAVRKSTKLWSPKPANGLPKEFLDAAERVRIETAIRLAAEQLDKEKIAKERYAKEHDQAVEREKKDEAEAKRLHAKAVSLAQKAIEQRTTYHVEQDRAETADKEIGLEKRIASLMASKSESLKSHAEKSMLVAHEAASEAGELKKKIHALEKDATEKGEHGDCLLVPVNGSDELCARYPANPMTIAFSHSHRRLRRVLFSLIWTFSPSPPHPLSTSLPLPRSPSPCLGSSMPTRARTCACALVGASNAKCCQQLPSSTRQSAC